MGEKHLSSQFDHELRGASARVMEMGGLVESQIRAALQVLAQFEIGADGPANEMENRVNAMELEIDHELSSIIARRQPTAGDLRLLMAISKITANLERAGDEAMKIVRTVRQIVEHDSIRPMPMPAPVLDLRLPASLASTQLRKALDAFARLDVQTALLILKEDTLIDREYDGFVRKLITYMMEDPRTISYSLQLMSIAKAIERIGDHAKNISEYVIYVVIGEDVRHRSTAQVEAVIR